MQTNTKVFINKLTIFLIAPFAGNLYAFFRFGSKSSLIIFYLYYLYFGLTFTPSSEKLDSYRYIERFNANIDYTWEELQDKISLYFDFSSSRSKDIFLDVLYFIAANIGESYHILFFIVAAIFGYFMIKSLKIIIDFGNIKYSYIFYILFFWLIHSNPIFNINGIRYYTACWVAVYALLQINLFSNLKYYFLILLTPLIHGSFWILLLVLLIISLTKKFEKFWMIFFFVSLIGLGSSFVSVTSLVSESLPPFIQKMINDYTTSEEAIIRMSGGNKSLIIRILESMPQLFIALTIMLFMINRKHIRKDHTSHLIFQYILVYFSIFFSIISIPSLGRFLTIGIPFIILLWMRSYSTMYKYRHILYFGFPIAYSYSFWGWIVKTSAVSTIEYFFSPIIGLIYKITDIFYF